MAQVRPMLGDIELQQVQKIEVNGDQVLVAHGVPALEGDFLQRLDRRATQITITGVLTGPEAGEGLKALRDKFRAAEPVPFVADIATATRVDEVLIEEMGVRELAGKPERFEYAFTLQEYIPPPTVARETPPEPDKPDPHNDEIDKNVGTLIVEVEVEGQTDFDHSNTTVTVEGTKQDGTALGRRVLSNRANNIWTEKKFPAGDYTASAVVTDPEPMSGSEPAQVQAGQTTQVKIILHPGQVIAKAFIVHFWFDKAFIEPCMRAVLRQVAEYARDHSDEKMVIVGHTDMVGDRPPVEPLYNQSLSERRGRSVYAYLTYGRDQVGALAEWDQLRRNRTTGVKKSINDTWGTRQYQYMLQELRYYPGNVDEVHGPRTDAAVRTFQGDHGLQVDGIVGDDTWLVLIDEYLNQDHLAVPESQFLLNCEGEILKWIGCGEQCPVRNTEDAWRPNRRTEILFVRADALPCQVPEPDTFDLPTPGAVGSAWCLGPGNKGSRCCFQTRDTSVKDRWLVQPVEPGTTIVQGSITFEDGTPLANAEYVLISPDGEYMDGERPSGNNRGRPIPGITDADGKFAYLDKMRIGVYTLEIQGPYIARQAGRSREAAKGNVVCKRLDGSTDFDIVVDGATERAVIIQLEAIKFNYDSTSTANDAINIRKNASQFITIPEWQRGTSASPADSLAAYSIKETKGNKIMIQAKFITPNTGMSTAEIRAVSSTPHVLGEVKSKDVTFLPSGETDFEIFELQNVQIWDDSIGVGIHDITWIWQFRLQSTDPWTDFDTSMHRIYTILDVPKLPWQQAPYEPSNIQLPWTDVLEYACLWAMGRIDLDNAAAEITRRVYDLGNTIIEYDCPNGGRTHYSNINFNCTAFLERLRGQHGLGRYVNCTDCGTIVSTFSNILGCDLWQSQMGFDFDLNPILAIGSNTWQRACGWPGFNYHEVAWKDQCTWQDEVFDACLQVDDDADPTRAPHTPRLPANMRFGNMGDGLYRDRLAADTPTGRPKCQPQPSTRTRRRII